MDKWKGLLPAEVVAITFTRKAATELRGRIRRELTRHRSAPVSADDRDGIHDSRLKSDADVEMLVSAIEDAPREISIYVSENSHQDHAGQFRRHSIRIDGFVSLAAPLSGGELVTRPINFQGNQLSLNLSTSAAGSVRVEIQAPDGKAVPGFSLAESHPLYGDSLDLKAAWTGKGSDVGALAGKAVRLRFRVEDADVFSYRFEGV